MKSQSLTTLETRVNDPGRQPGVAIRAAACLLACLLSWSSPAQEIFDEPFAGSTTPPGWEFRGASLMESDSLKPTPDGSYQSWGNAFYTARTFYLGDFVLTAEIRVAGADPLADGLSFSWVDSTRFGAPHGSVPGQTNTLDGFSGGSVGIPDFYEGYALTLRSRADTPPQSGLFRTDRSVLFEQSIRLVTAEESYQNVDWVPLRLTVKDGQFTLEWGGTAGAYRHSFTFTLPLGPDYATQYQVYEKAWFGLGGATGDSTENHAFRNVRLVSSPAVPAPVLDVEMLAGLRIWGVVGATYRIDYQRDLTDVNSWAALTNLVLPETPYFWVDVSSTNQPQRYYRAVVVP